MTAQPDPVSRAQVHALIAAFYADVRQDALLAPVFARALHRDWPEHLALMTDFWCTALKLERSFRGNVYGRHVPLSRVTREHLLRWLGLWRMHTLRHLPCVQAERAQGAAVGMVRVLHLGWFGSLPTREALGADVRAAAAALPA